jgi:hypothetical protein
MDVGLVQSQQRDQSPVAGAQVEDPPRRVRDVSEQDGLALGAVRDRVLAREVALGVLACRPLGQGPPKLCHRRSAGRIRRAKQGESRSLVLRGSGA